MLRCQPVDRPVRARGPDRGRLADASRLHQHDDHPQPRRARAARRAGSVQGPRAREGVVPARHVLQATAEAALHAAASARRPHVAIDQQGRPDAVQRHRHDRRADAGSHDLARQDLWPRDQLTDLEDGSSDPGEDGRRRAETTSTRERQALRPTAAPPASSGSCPGPARSAPRSRRWPSTRPPALPGPGPIRDTDTGTTLCRQRN